LYAQSFNLNQSEFEEDDYYIELPYQKIKEKIIIDVSLNGQILKFILDTGAPTAIRKGLAEKLDLEILTREDISDINDMVSEFNIVKIDQLILSGIMVKNIPAVVFEENLMTECFEVDGLIGSNLFHNSVIQFDDKNNLIRISSTVNNLDVLNAQPADIYIDKQSSPIFQIELGRKAKEMLLFDTGSDDLYSMSNAKMLKFKKTKSFRVISNSTGITSIGINGLEQESKSYRLAIPELTFSGLTLNNIVSETTTDPNSRIGSRLLRFGRLTIDYKNSKSYFEPYPKVSDSKELFWNLSPTFIDGKLVIGRIWTKEWKNISIGDSIISINDINMENVSECDFLLNSPLSNIKSASLKIRNSKGVVVSIEIQKE
jgi:hypothetical protein